MRSIWCRSISCHVSACYFDVEIPGEVEVSRLNEPQDEPISGWEWTMLAWQIC